jgi:hypothetical protein
MAGRSDCRFSIAGFPMDWRFIQKSAIGNRQSAP